MAVTVPALAMGPRTMCEAETPRTELPAVSQSTARRQRRRRQAERRAQLELDPQEFRRQLRAEPKETLQSLVGQVWTWSQHPVGCRLVQEVFELGTRDAAELVCELHGHVMEAVVCPHANYVIQKVVSHLSVASSAFVARELQGHSIRVVKHRFACRIFCRLLEFCPSAVAPLVDELMPDLPSLITHNFAHHVIESILENGQAAQKRLVTNQLLAEPLRYATHKNSSYVVEKALRHAEAVDVNALSLALASPQNMLELARTPFGSYVAKALVQEGQVDVAAMRLIRLHQCDLEGSAHGQRFLEDVGLREAGC